MQALFLIFLYFFRLFVCQGHFLIYMNLSFPSVIRLIKKEHSYFGAIFNYRQLIQLSELLVVEYRQTSVDWLAAGHTKKTSGNSLRAIE